MINHTELYEKARNLVEQCRPQLRHLLSQNEEARLTEIIARAFIDVAAEAKQRP